MEETKSCCTPGRASTTPADAAPIRRAPATPTNTRGMKRLDGGVFLMGTDDADGFPDDGEGPIREVTLDPFYIDATSVTNKQFGRFVKETGYKTEAEGLKNSFVFYLLAPKEMERRMHRRVVGCEWWLNVPGACWKQPEGRGSNIKDRMDHPVTHVSWHDAQAYCVWAGKRLPTEAEYEYAARGGLVQNKYAWGDALHLEGEHRCNIWQGTFPDHNTLEDGYLGTSPVRAFPANGYGIHDMAGNVWEWCADCWSPNFHANGSQTNPTGPASGDARVIRGGSYLCHDSYCNRYRVAARTSNTPDSSTGNLGFRCVVDVVE